MNPTYIVPFHFDPPLDPTAAINVSVNGREPMRFTVDTGLSSTLFIHRWAALRCGLPLTGPAVSSMIGPQRLIRVPIDSVVFTDRSGQNIVHFSPKVGYVCERDDAEERRGAVRVAGLIGMAFFQKYLLELDFRSKTLIMRTPPFGAWAQVDCAELTLREHTRWYSVRSRLSGDPYEMIVDTGSDFTGVSNVRNLNSAWPSTRKKIWMFDGCREYVVALVPSIHIGNRDVGPVELCCLSANKPGILGLDVLSRFVTVLDYKNRRFALREHNEGPCAPRIQAEIGFTLTTAGTECRVDSIDSNSTAFQSGLRRGDVIFEIDGIRTSGLSIPAISRLLAGYAGIDANVVVGRTPKLPRLTRKSTDAHFALTFRADRGTDLRAVRIPRRSPYKPS